MKKAFKQDHGVAGLTVLMSVIVMLFVIGLLAMIFVLMSGEIKDTDIMYDRSPSTTVGLEAITLTDAGTNVSIATYRGAICTLVAVYNGTAQISNGNVSEISECKFKNTTSSYDTYKLNYTYTYLYDKHGIIKTINNTTASIGGVADWFDIFIVISAMVVLILLTVIIITAIKGSGMIAGGNGQHGANQVGTA